MNKYFILVLAVATVLFTGSCGSTEKFAKKTKNVNGTLFITANQEFPVISEAFKYGFNRMKIKFDKETKIDANTMQILGTQKSSMQDWGQNIKVTIIMQGATCEVYYLAQPRISMNVTANVKAVQNNLHTYVSNYLEAAREGIDLNKVEL